MIPSSIIPTRRSRWPGALSIVLWLATVALLILIAKLPSASDIQQQNAALEGYDQGFADAMNSVAETVGAAYSTGYRAAQREASAACSSPRQGAPL